MMTSTSAIAALEAVIRAHLTEWEKPFVELAIHGTGDSYEIAHSIDALCRRELGSPVAEPLFYQSSIGAVAGVLLADGRRVVIKAHQPDQRAEHLRDVTKLQRHLAATERIAPPVVGGPTPLGGGLATIEEYCARGKSRDGHDPTIRRALAVGFHRVIQALEPFVDDANLSARDLPASSLWPTPHSRLFAFDATTDGAGYIDDIARAARGRITSAGRRVISHGDWRAEHVRFEGDKISIAYDWDSLCLSHEPAAVGTAAHMFCADWSRDDVVQAPTFEAARAFVDEYESARGQPFSREERSSCGGAFAYAVAYTARCGHAVGVDIRLQPGNHQHLIAAHGAALMEL